MSTIRPSDRDLVPVGWVQTSWTDTMEFTHHATGLRFEATKERSSPRPGVDDGTCWTLRCRKSAGEMETEVPMGHAVTEARAKRQLAAWMQAFNRLKNEYGWDETVAVGTVANGLTTERTRAVDGNIDRRQEG